MSKISLKRPITSYTKIQLFWAEVIRGKRFFINKKNIKGKVLLNIGCGPYTKSDFINLDYSWHPHIDICWDITKKKYPLQDGSLEGIFTEHCLEHIPYKKCEENIKEFYRLLKPNGTLRIVVPDGEIYADLYQKRKIDKTVKLPYDEGENTAMISINRIFRSHGHLFIYDFETFNFILEKAGFKHIEKQKFRTGEDARLLIDRPERAVESLYVEAKK